MPRKDRPSEKDIHEQFFSDIFVDALGYQKRTAKAPIWSIASEDRTDVDATRPDGILGFFSEEAPDKDVQVVIELKSLGCDLDRRQNRAGDNRTPVDQAFSYAHKYDDVRWVILSNYQEIRLYHKNSSKHSFHVDLSQSSQDDSELKLFYYFLNKDNLLGDSELSLTEKLYRERKQELLDITNQFYALYKAARLATVKDIITHNAISPWQAVEHAQTILDRILFIAFLEGYTLIRRGTIKKSLFYPE